MVEVKRDGWTTPAAGMAADLLVEVSLAVRGWYPTASVLTIARDRFGIWMPTSVRDPDGMVLVSAHGRLSGGGALHALAAELGAALDYLVDLLPAEARARAARSFWSPLPPGRRANPLPGGRGRA